MSDQKINWEKITITNNFMFCTVMQKPEICKEFLETMLKIRIDHIEYVKAEDSIKTDIFGKGIRLDVHVKDSNREFDLEMQMSDTHELPLRARFYQSLLDAATLDRGEFYEDLKESYIIFICPFDLFNKSLPVYTFEKICLEDSGVKLGDKTQSIFYNFSEWRKVHDEEIKNMLKYFNGEKAESALSTKID
ncbi:MAG: Rpn family recombination-promoting nuclease/putative transposase, partial [Treponema sp.]|nr:Rpn family recombination-promoting nuclease/putative transposase [Treponema sp.]